MMRGAEAVLRPLARGAAGADLYCVGEACPHRAASARLDVQGIELNGASPPCSVPLRVNERQFR